MSVFRPRNRLVNFRLSEDEFERLRTSCAQHGARSISDFARSSVLRRLEEAPGSQNLPSQLSHLGHKLTELESRVGQLVRIIASGRGDGEEAVAAVVGTSADRLSRI